MNKFYEKQNTETEAAVDTIISAFLGNISANGGTYAASQANVLEMESLFQNGELEPTEEVLSQLFEGAYSIGALSAEKRSYYPDDYFEMLIGKTTGLIGCWLDLVSGDIEESDQKYYLRRDLKIISFLMQLPISLNQLTKEIIALGLASGFALNLQNSICLENFFSLSPQGIDIRSRFINSNFIFYLRNMFTTEIRNNPGRMFQQILGYSSIGEINSVEELGRVEQALLLLFPDYQTRIDSVMEGKKRSKAQGSVQLIDNKVVQKSIWDKEFVDPLLPQAEELGRNLKYEMKQAQKSNVAMTFEELADVLESLAELVPLGVNVITALQSFRKDFENGRVNWPAVRSALKSINLDENTNIIDQGKRFQAKELLDKATQIVTKGVAEDKAINLLDFEIANRLSRLKLAEIIFLRDVGDDDLPENLLLFLSTVLTEFSKSKMPESLSEDALFEIFIDFIRIYREWNSIDKLGITPQSRIVIPTLVRAKVLQKDQSVDNQLDIEEALAYLRKLNEQSGLPFPGIESLKNNLEESGTVRMAVKVCPSRRPSRLISPETRDNFYESNPYKSDAVELMIATQDIINKLREYGVRCEITYVVIPTDERDYLTPLVTALGYENGKRPIGMQKKLDAFSNNLQLFAELAMPGVPIEVIQIEKLEQIIYGIDYPLAYQKEIDQVAKEIGEDPSEATRVNLEKAAETYKERFSEGGLYSAFYSPDIDFKQIALRRAATYPMQAKTVLKFYDLLLDTPENPTIERLKMFRRRLPTNAAPISNAYGAYGKREDLQKLFYLS